jgi:hypothetical protein
MRRLAGTLLASCVCLQAACSRTEPLASAPDVALIVNGEPDGTTHGNVGALLYDFDADGEPTSDDLLCSGSYVGEASSGSVELFLTAGHCLAWPRDPGVLMWVTFDPDLTDGVDDAVPTGTGYVDPGFGHDEGDLHDLALVGLPAGTGAALGLVPADLPPLNLLTMMSRRGGLRGTLFENVGYGLNATFKQGQPRFSLVDMRMVSLSPFMALTGSRLGLLMNQDATGLGGDCYGDSGAPKFLRGTNTIVATVSWGDANCRATSWNQRLDTQSARAFLGQHLELP